MSDLARLAQALIEPGAAPPRAEGEVLALGWALKDLCYRLWAAEPTQAARAAEVLGQLHQSAEAQAWPAEPTARKELAGAARWTAAIAHVTRGELPEALQALDDADGLLAQAGREDAAAQTQVPRIMVLSLLGRHEEAAACGEAAGERLLALGNVAAAARVRMNLGSLQMRRDRYAEAVRHFRQATVLLARSGDTLNSVLADIGLADNLALLGDFEEAAHIFERARLRSETHALAQPLALVDEGVALLALARGRYREALVGMESARRRLEALGLPHALAIVEKQLADIYLDLHLLPEALALYDAVAERFASQGLPDEQALVQVQRGRCLASLGRAAQAAQAFEAAEQLFHTQGNAIGQAGVQLARGELALAQDGDAPAALARVGQALPALQAGQQAEAGVRAELLRAQALLASGEVAAASADFQQVLERARQQQLLQAQVQCHTGLGLVALQAGEREAARAAFETAIELLEVQRQALPGDELRGAFLGSQSRPYEACLALALESGNPAEVLREAERGRASSLGEPADVAAADLPASVPGAGQAESLGAEREGALRERLSWLHRRVQRVHDEGGDAAVLTAELRKAEHALLEQARRRRLLAGAQSAAEAVRLDPQSLLRAVQQVLAPDDALVEYGVADGRLFALVVGAGSIHLAADLGSWAEVRRAIEAARFQLDSLRHGATPISQHLAQLATRTRQRLGQLHGWLWKPLEPWLTGARRVLLVPHAELAGVPFAALPCEGPEGPALIERHELLHAASARAAMQALRRPALPLRHALLLGEATRLPQAAAEVTELGMLLNATGVEVRSLLGEHASQAELAAAAPQADLLHLACHAQYRSDNPRFSALHLADAPLAVEQLEAWQLKPCTVVLSACETALADRKADPVGLVRGFLHAGAARVLATLWPVRDDVAREFAALFYDGLLRGRSAAAALVGAQKALAHRHPHPSVWAAFTLWGAW